MLLSEDIHWQYVMQDYSIVQHCLAIREQPLLSEGVESGLTTELYLAHELDLEVV